MSFRPLSVGRGTPGPANAQVRGSWFVVRGSRLEAESERPRFPKSSVSVVVRTALRREPARTLEPDTTTYGGPTHASFELETPETTPTTPRSRRSRIILTCCGEQVATPRSRGQCMKRRRRWVLPMSWHLFRHLGRAPRNRPPPPRAGPRTGPPRQTPRAGPARGVALRQAPREWPLDRCRARTFSGRDRGDTGGPQRHDGCRSAFPKGACGTSTTAIVSFRPFSASGGPSRGSWPEVRGLEVRGRVQERHGAAHAAESRILAR